MAELTPHTLNHFAFYTFKDVYWQRPAAERGQFHQQWLDGLGQAAPAVHLYQVFPAGQADILVWSALAIEATCDTAGFLARYAQATNPYRHLLHPTAILWGYTRPSEYTRTRSTRELDPFNPDQPRQPYLVVYPFVKTTEWYLLSGEQRRELMFEHIRIGKQYPEVAQVLLYSFGLQDQEFVLVYEMADLAAFSRLVHELRSTAVRRFTERDTPLYTAVYHPAAETLALF
jgi:chlorite dismutase